MLLSVKREETVYVRFRVSGNKREWREMKAHCIFLQKVQTMRGFEIQKVSMMVPPGHHSPCFRQQTLRGRQVLFIQL